MPENPEQSAETAAETNNTSNAAENSEPMQVSDGATAEASTASDGERREMVIDFNCFLFFNVISDLFKRI